VPLKTAKGADLMGEDDCTLQLAAERAKLAACETVWTKLEREQRDRAAVEASAEVCRRDLDRSRQQGVAALEKCERRIAEAQLNATSSVDACRKQSAETAARLQKCGDELAAAGDTARSKAAQSDRCSQSLVDARSQLQTLSSRLAESQSSCDSEIRRRMIQHTVKIDSIVSDMEQRHQEEMELTSSVCASLFLLLVLCLYFWLIPFVYRLVLSITANVFRFRNFVGLRNRESFYRVNFRSPRYR